MIISNSKKFIFVHIHKTGGTSITQVLSSTILWNDIVCGSTPYGYKLGQVFEDEYGVGKHATADEIRNLVNLEVWEEYFTFSFVRHPVRRVLSLYNWTSDMVNNRGWRRKIGAQMAETLRKNTFGLFGDDIWDWPTVKAFLATDSFSGYIRHPEFARSPATQSQFNFLSDPGSRNLIVDFVGQLENIEKDLGHICREIGITGLNIRKSNQSSKRSLQITEEDRSYLRDWYHVDFEAFGYEQNI